MLAALQTGPVDLYGDSYGSYFGQTFAARYPRLLRSLTLDATWPVLGTDPFYISTIETARIAFDLTCRRSVACALAAPGSSMARIGALAERLRRAPVVGRTREPGSAPSTWRVDVGVLIALVNNAGSDAGVYRELDAAARAVLERRDGAPLLRLAAKSLYTDDGGPVREWSAGQYIAVSCTDYPQAFDMRAPPAVRRAQYEAAAGRPARRRCTRRSPSRSGRPRRWPSSTTASTGRRRSATTRPSPDGRRWSRRPCRCWCCRAGSTP